MSPWLDLSCNIISSNFDDPILCKNNYLDFASSLVIKDKNDYNLLPFIQFGTIEILYQQF